VRLADAPFVIHFIPAPDDRLGSTLQPAGQNRGKFLCDEPLSEPDRLDLAHPRQPRGLSDRHAYRHDCDSST